MPRTTSPSNATRTAGSVRCTSGCTSASTTRVARTRTRCGSPDHRTTTTCRSTTRAELVPQLALQDLARRVAGERRVDDRDAGGHLEPGEVLAHVRLERLDGEGRAGARHHRGRDLFAQSLVGYPEHRGLVHVGVFVEGGLDLGAVDVLA